MEVVLSTTVADIIMTVAGARPVSSFDEVAAVELLGSASW
jgi:hypothetical protein